MDYLYIIIQTQNKMKKVTIRRNGPDGSFIAQYVQESGSNFGGFQVLDTKFFATQKNAEKWAAKMLAK